jgi:hypothetical protein
VNAVPDAEVTHVRPKSAERITVSLIPEAAEALEKLLERTGLKKVDLVNRALTIYQFIDAERRAGNELVLRRPDGQEQLIKIF